MYSEKSGCFFASSHSLSACGMKLLATGFKVSKLPNASNWANVLTPLPLGSEPASPIVSAVSGRGIGTTGRAAEVGWGNKVVKSSFFTAFQTRGGSFAFAFGFCFDFAAVGGGGGPVESSSRFLPMAPVLKLLQGSFRASSCRRTTNTYI